MTAPTRPDNALPDGFSVTTVTLNLTRAQFKKFKHSHSDVPGTEEYWATPPTTILWLGWGHPDNSYYWGKGWEGIERKYVGTLLRAFKNMRAKFPGLQPLYGVIAMGTHLRLYREKLATGNAAEDEELAVEQFWFNERNIFDDYNDCGIVKQWMLSVPLNFKPDTRLDPDIRELYAWDPISIESLGMSWLDSDESD
ncbi:hypothetical protein AnigIFM60653_002000 [Aspergillus niger]|nr:hypothetical protein AnigIFM50267_010048 [Aspergillus niger]GLA02526.1 hypothetical protein AnigIFM60653_002000 [Aspergillus niger]